jgi:hypothetical protein
MTDPATTPIGLDDPAAVLPLESARASLAHWWREPAAGALALAIGCFDSWHFGRDLGLTSSLDELLIVAGIVLIAGSRRLFAGLPEGK